MSERDHGRDATSINDPDIREDDPEYGPRPVRSTLQAVVRLFLGAFVIGVLALAVWALLV